MSNEPSLRELVFAAHASAHGISVLTEDPEGLAPRLRDVITREKELTRVLCVRRSPFRPEEELFILHETQLRDTAKALGNEDAT